MCSVDMGGPVNKAAYVTGTMLLGAGLEAGVGTDAYADGTAFMAAVSAACIVPPLVTSFAVIAGKKYFSQEDHDAGIVNIILGCTHITEGAIPFMTKNIWPVMPIMMLSAAIASVLTLLLGVHVPAPHGGFLVLPVVDGGIQWVLAILAGTVVGGILFTIFKKREWTRAQQQRSASATDDAVVAGNAAETAVAVAPKAAADGFVSAENVLFASSDLDRDAALDAIVAAAVDQGIVDDAAALRAAFLKREAEGTTGMVDGYAIPHAKTDAVKRASVLVLKADGPVASWETLDGAPVTCAIALLVPESEAGTSHLQILSKVATALTDDSFRAAFKAESDPARLAELINARLD